MDAALPLVLEVLSGTILPLLEGGIVLDGSRIRWAYASRFDDTAHGASYVQEPLLPLDPG